jgi:hypothetical protein
LVIIHKGKQAAEFFNVGQRFPLPGGGSNEQMPGPKINKRRVGLRILLFMRVFGKIFSGFSGYFFELGVYKVNKIVYNK